MLELVSAGWPPFPRSIEIPPAIAKPKSNPRAKTNIVEIQGKIVWIEKY